MSIVVGATLAVALDVNSSLEKGTRKESASNLSWRAAVFFGDNIG